jgi:integrase
MGGFSRRHAATLNQAILALEAKRILDSVHIIHIPSKTPRPTSLPVSIAEIERIDSFHEMRRFILSEWIEQSLTFDRLLFLFIFDMLATAGFVAPLFLNLLSYLRMEDIAEDCQSIVVPVSRDGNSGRLRVFLPQLATIALAELVTRTPKLGSGSFLVLPNIRGNHDRTTALKELVEREFGELTKDFDSHCTQKSLQLPKVTCAQFLREAWRLALFDGAEPYILKLQSAEPLPRSPLIDRTTPNTSQSDGAALRYELNVQEIHRAEGPPETCGDEEEIPELPRVQDWSRKATSILRKLRKDFAKISKQNLAYDAHRAKATALIEEAQKLADLALGEHAGTCESALHLALDWLKHKLSSSSSLKASSIDTYLSRVFTSGIFQDDRAAFFSRLNPIDHLEIFENAVDSRSLGEKARRDTKCTWLSVYRYAQQNGYCQDVPLNHFRSDYAIPPSRQILIGIEEFDAFIEELMEAGGESETLAVLFMLCFYGGLRSGEAADLILKRINVSGDMIDIFIGAGKTRAARRIVNFGLLAPPRACKHFRQYVLRRFSCEASPIKKLFVPLFGPVADGRGYTGESLLNAANALLKKRFGTAVTLHTLRHSFVSWALVRLAVLRTPGFLRHVPDAGNPIYSDEALRRFESLFTLNTSIHISEKDTHLLVILSKILGHSTPQTMMTIYLHTFEFLQRDLIERLDWLHGDTPLSGKATAALCSMARSRSTHAKYSLGTLKSLSAFVRNRRGGELR